MTHTFDDSIAEIQELNERRERERNEVVPNHIRTWKVRDLTTVWAPRVQRMLVYQSITQVLESFAYEVWDTCARVHGGEKET